MLKKIISGFIAGSLVSIGGAVFLNCCNENRFVGSVFFCVALICICYKGYSLYTGKIGLMPQKHTKEDFSVLLLGLVGNLLGTFACGSAFRYAVGGMGDISGTLCASKLEQGIFQTLIRAFFCGVLMYFAVSIFSENRTVLGVVFCIPAFIFAGFEHSVADAFYMFCAGMFSAKVFIYLFVVLIGNTLGSLVIAWLTAYAGSGTGKTS